MLNYIDLNHIFIQSKVASNNLIVILHGRGDSSNGFTFLPSYLQIDSLNYLLLDAPNDYFDGYSWYDLPPNQKQGIIQSSQILTDTFDTLFQDRFEAKSTVLFGFSQGSLLTFEFGARYQHALAGYIAISGYIYNKEELIQDMNKDVKESKWLCTHGTLDAVLPYETSKKQIEFLQENNFNVEFITYQKEHTIHEKEIIDIKNMILKILAL